MGYLNADRQPPFGGNLSDPAPELPGHFEIKRGKHEPGLFGGELVHRGGNQLLLHETGWGRT